MLVVHCAGNQGQVGKRMSGTVAQAQETGPSTAGAAGGAEQRPPARPHPAWARAGRWSQSKTAHDGEARRGGRGGAGAARSAGALGARGCMPGRLRQGSGRAGIPTGRQSGQGRRQEGRRTVSATHLQAVGRGEGGRAAGRRRQVVSAVHSRARHAALAPCIMLKQQQLQPASTMLAPATVGCRARAARGASRCACVRAPLQLQHIATACRHAGLWPAVSSPPSCGAGASQPAGVVPPTPAPVDPHPPTWSSRMSRANSPIVTVLRPGTPTGLGLNSCRGRGRSGGHLRRRCSCGLRAGVRPAGSAASPARQRH